MKIFGDGGYPLFLGKFPSPPCPRSGLVHEVGEPLRSGRAGAASDSRIFFNSFYRLLVKRLIFETNTVLLFTLQLAAGVRMTIDELQTLVRHPSSVCTRYSPIRGTDGVAATSRYTTGTGTGFPIGKESQ
jgi:hypothetical protein